jgi:hypothetical protein
MPRPELYRRTQVVAFSVSEGIALPFHSALVAIAERHRERAVRFHLDGKSSRSPHLALASKSYAVLRFHEIKSAFGMLLQKVAIYKRRDGWRFELDSRSVDPGADVFHFLDRLSVVTGVKIDVSDLNPLPCPFVELITALEADSYLRAAEEDRAVRDPHVRRFGGKILESHRLEAKLPGYEDHPFTYEAVVTHQGFKRNRSPKLVRFEFVPIARHGYSPLTFQHARLPAALGNDGWIQFAKYIHNLLVNENPDLPYARVPSYWRGVPIAMNTLKAPQWGKATNRSKGNDE